MLSSDENSYQNYTKLIDFKENYITKNVLLNENTRWNKPFFFIAYRYLACINQFEFFEEDQCFNTNEVAITDAITHLEKQLEIINMTTEEFRQRFGKEMAATLLLDFDVGNYPGIKRNINAFNIITYINLQKICYSVATDQYPYEKGLSCMVDIIIHNFWLG